MDFEHPQIVAFLQEQAGAVPDCAPTETERCPARRYLPLSPSSRGLFRIDTRTGIFDLWQPNTAALTGLHDVWGISNPLELVHWHTLWENNGGRHTRIYDLLNVLYVLVRDGTPLPEQYTLAYDAPGPLAVYENPDPLPRAWLVSAAQILPDQEAVLAALQQPSFEPLHTVVYDAAQWQPADVRRPPTSRPHRAWRAPVSILFIQRETRSYWRPPQKGLAIWFSAKYGTRAGGRR